jgi:ribose-phosphate pyrophosphokinase
VDELTAAYTIARYFAQQQIEDPVVVAPDLGGAKRARNLAERLNAPLALVEKRRISNHDQTELMTVIGEIKGRRAIIIDDEIDTAGTLCQTVQAVCERGVVEVYAAATHGTLSGPAVQRLCASPLREVVLSDTVPLPPEKQIDRFQVLTVAPLLGEAISRIHTGQSVGALFQ